jgi:hypothetical protein
MGVFAVDTLDLAGVEWSPDDSAIVAWDSILEYKVHVLSLHKFLGRACVLWLVTVVNSYAISMQQLFVSPLIYMLLLLIISIYSMPCSHVRTF